MLANAVSQSLHLLLIHRIREQARSHILFSSVFEIYDQSPGFCGLSHPRIRRYSCSCPAWLLSGRAFNDTCL